MVVFPFFFWPFCCVVQPDICAYCAEVGAERDRDTLETHRIVLPVFAENIWKKLLKLILNSAHPYHLTDFGYPFKPFVFLSSKDF
jgi:hypothetical protein